MRPLPYRWTTCARSACRGRLRLTRAILEPSIPAVVGCVMGVTTWKNLILLHSPYFVCKINTAANNAAAYCTASLFPISLELPHTALSNLVGTV